MKDSQTTQYVTNTSIPNRQDLDQLITTYAPLLYFHPEENYKTTSVNLYLERAYLVNNLSNSRKQASIDDLPSSPEKNGYYLELKRPHSAFKENSAHQTKIYVRAIAKEHRTTELQFWFFFPINGSVTVSVKWLIDSIAGHNVSHMLDPLGKQEGCWRCLKMLIDNKSSEIKKVFIPQPGAGQWLDSDKFQRSGKQIILFVSKDSHFFYPEVGLNPSNLIHFDIHSTVLEFYFKNETLKGELLNCIGCCELVSAEFLEDNKPSEPTWLNYACNWGKENDIASDQTELKTLIKQAFGVKLDFLLNTSVLNDLTSFLQAFFTDKQKEISRGPKFRACWQETEMPQNTLSR